jgi:hypothetical protein
MSSIESLKTELRLAQIAKRNERQKLYQRERRSRQQHRVEFLEETIRQMFNLVNPDKAEQALRLYNSVFEDQDISFQNPTSPMSDE